MNEGHEDCPTVSIEYRALCDPEQRVMTRCLHEHREAVAADDGLGTGPVVADHCHCCGVVLVREDWK